MGPMRRVVPFKEPGRTDVGRVGGKNAWRLPADGVGLARLEFIAAHQVKVHPMALLHPERIDPHDRHVIDRITEGYLDRGQYFVERLAHGIARIAASRWPAPVVVRTSDFKSNEYAKLLGGRPFEPDEANPMIGWRGASRYYSDGYREGFALECRALRRVREEMGLTNVVVMIPFWRTLGEADQVLAVMAEEGLVRGQNGLRVYVMAEIPANIILAQDFAERFEGSRSAATTPHATHPRRRPRLRGPGPRLRRARPARRPQYPDPRSPRPRGRPAGLCGQRPSDDPAFTAILVAAGLDSISVAPDSFAAVKRHVARAEATLETDA